MLHFQINEIDKANLSLGEEELLNGKKNKLQHAEKIHGSVKLALNLIAEKDGAVLDILGMFLKDYSEFLY